MDARDISNYIFIGLIYSLQTVYISLIKLHIGASPLPMEARQIVGSGSGLAAFERGRIFIVPYLLWHSTALYTVSSELLHCLVSSYGKRGDLWTYFNPVLLGTIT